MVCHLRLVTHERHETHKRNKEETRRLAVLVIFSHHPSNISIECFFCRAECLTGIRKCKVGVSSYCDQFRRLVMMQIH